MTADELTEICLRNLREHRDDMARWLAVEVLLGDSVALEDDILQGRLIAFQDRLEELTRLRYGVAGATTELDLSPGAKLEPEHP